MPTLTLAPTDQNVTLPNALNLSTAPLDISWRSGSFRTLKLLEPERDCTGARVRVRRVPNQVTVRYFRDHIGVDGDSVQRASREEVSTKRQDDQETVPIVNFATNDVMRFESPLGGTTLYSHENDIRPVHHTHKQTKSNNVLCVMNGTNKLYYVHAPRNRWCHPMTGGGLFLLLVGAAVMTFNVAAGFGHE